MIFQNYGRKPNNPGKTHTTTSSAQLPTKRMIIFDSIHCPSELAVFELTCKLCPAQSVITGQREYKREGKHAVVMAVKLKAFGQVIVTKTCRCKSQMNCARELPIYCISGLWYIVYWNFLVPRKTKTGSKCIPRPS